MKLLNQYIGLMLLSGLIMLTAGCDEIQFGNEFLERPPELDYTLDSVFSSADRAREALWNAYATMPYGINSRGRDDTDGWRGGIGRSPRWVLTNYFNHGVSWDGVTIHYMNGTYNAEAENKELNWGQWHGTGKYAWLRELGWEGIRDSYVFMDNIDKVPDMSEDEKNLLTAEAQMIVAIHYTQMFRHYGGILYVDHAYSPDEDFSLERLTVMQSVDTILAMIDRAIPHLPFELDNPEQWSGRWTAAGAMGLKVKLLEFAAAPLFNSDQPFMQGEAVDKNLVWTGGYQRSLWEKLRDASKELIDKIEASSYYGLVNTGNPRLDYRNGYYARGTGETLISVRRMYSIDSRWESGDKDLSLWTFGQTSWDVANPLHNFAVIFPMQNGKSIEDPTSGYDPQNPFADRDPRFYENLNVLGNIRSGRKTEMWIGGRDRRKEDENAAYTGYRTFKWILDGEFMILNQPQQFPFIRIPEVYLAYAEALNELNNGPTPQAFEYVNKVRERVEVGPIEDFIGKPQGDITKEEFLQALLNERSIELTMEDNRWYDMVRYKMQDQFESDDLKLNITLNNAAENMEGFTSYFQDEVSFDEQGNWFNFEVKELRDNRFAWQDGFDPKYYLSAFPLDEVQKGYGLVQNPGYEIN